MKKYKEFEENELENRIIDIKNLLILYANDEILSKFFEWNIETQKKDNQHKQFNVYIDLIIMIRKDMGHPKSNLKRDDIIRSICNSEETYLELKVLLG